MKSHYVNVLPLKSLLSLLSSLLLCACLTPIGGLIPQSIKLSPMSLKCLGSFLGS